jgi:hypothetical protein
VTAPSRTQLIGLLLVLGLLIALAFVRACGYGLSG